MQCLPSLFYMRVLSRGGVHHFRTGTPTRTSSITSSSHSASAGFAFFLLVTGSLVGLRLRTWADSVAIGSLVCSSGANSPAISGRATLCYVSKALALQSLWAGSLSKAVVLVITMQRSGTASVQLGRLARGAWVVRIGLPDCRSSHPQFPSRLLAPRTCRSHCPEGLYMRAFRRSLWNSSMPFAGDRRWQATSSPKPRSWLLVLCCSAHGESSAF